MIASQFILDQRLAELRQTCTTEYADQAGTAAASTVARISAAIRSLFGGAAAGRPRPGRGTLIRDPGRANQPTA